MSMKRNVRDRWVKALRSGRYKQTTGQLGQRDKSGKESFCCLGVLAKVAAAEKSIERPVWDIDELIVVDGDAWHNDELPAAIRKQVGLTDLQQRRLVELNDDQNASFKAIADFIEKKIKVKD